MVVNGYELAEMMYHNTQGWSSKHTEKGYRKCADMRMEV